MISTILIGWEGIGDIPYTNPTVALGWQHCLTLPRELTLSPDGGILQQPVRELQALRKESAGLRSGGTVKAQLPFEITGTTQDEFTLEFADVLRLKKSGSEFSLEFTNDSAGCARTVRYAQLGHCEDIRIIADKASVEVYLNGGEKVLSSRMYPQSTELSLTADGIDAVIYKLDGIEVISDE